MTETQVGVNKRERVRIETEGDWLTKMWSDNRPDVYANRFDTPRVSPAGASEWWGGGRRAPLSPTAQQMSTFNPPLNGDGAEGSTAKWKWRPFSQRKKEGHIQLPGGNPEPSLLPNGKFLQHMVHYTLPSDVTVHTVQWLSWRLRNGSMPKSKSYEADETSDGRFIPDVSISLDI